MRRGGQHRRDGGTPGCLTVAGVRLPRVELAQEIAVQARVARDASQMYSSNLLNLVAEYWDEEEKSFNLDLADHQVSHLVGHHCSTSSGPEN